MLALAEFAAKFHELVEQDSPRGLSVPNQRTLLDSEADKLMAHLYEYVVETCGLWATEVRLAQALSKTRLFKSEQDRAAAILHILSV